jgi:hypothetical protein
MISECNFKCNFNFCEILGQLENYIQLVVESVEWYIDLRQKSGDYG